MKRSAADSALVVIQDEKRKREDAGAVVVSGTSGSKYGQVMRARTSDLEAPVMKLTGHKSEVLSMRFSPQGNTFASGGTDRLLYIWNVYGDCSNLNRMKGHENAILELQYSRAGDQIYTASADKTVCIWDVQSLTRVKKIRASKEIVNACATCPRGDALLAAGGDDGTCRLWDVRTPKRASQEYEGGYPVTGVAMALSGDAVYVGDVSGDIQVWDTRKEEILYTLSGHQDMVTSVAMSPDGTHVLSNAADNTLRMWDVRPFVAGGDAARCAKVFVGHSHDVEKNLLRCSWHPSGEFVAAASADHPPHHYIWRAATGRVEYQLPGHRACINDVQFHPEGHIIGSCSSDHTIYLGELPE
eukprot:TRINITY_DN9927_c0_g1_i1.p1 TRINITY_DN9927_c0_g1~~TRINITY_DN9927_c0_g1_i1.p1  ORF type:complete len:357 (+),score=117.97 TRINITY_DN9927_c0_g1_i1:39-1109(+)